MSTVPIHFAGVFVVLFGMLAAQAIDFDHVPAIIEKGAWNMLQCVYKLKCYTGAPNEGKIDGYRALFHWNPEIPLHNIGILIVLTSLLFIVRIFNKNAFLTLLIFGLIIGVITHFFLDGMIKF
jgi:hypothetical protein